MKNYKKCLYKGRRLEIRSERGDGTLTVIALDGFFAMTDGGWERVDKLEWEKTVPISEVTLLPDEEASA